MATFVTEELLKELIAEGKKDGKDVSSYENELAIYQREGKIQSNTGPYEMTREINGQEVKIKSFVPMDESHFAGLEKYDLKSEE